MGKQEKHPFLMRCCGVFENDDCLSEGNFRKVFGNLRKIIKKVVISMYCLYSKQNNTWVLVEIHAYLQAVMYYSDYYVNN